MINSGFSSDKFIYEGFLPHKKGRKKKLSQLKDETSTIIIYESPYRVIKLLNEIKEIFGDDRKISISREISKIYEETIYGTPNEIICLLKEKKIKGEFVVVIKGKEFKRHNVSCI